MKLGIAFVTGLVCANGALATSSFDIPLQRRGPQLNVDNVNMRTVVTYVKSSMMKYSNALKNYKLNTGEDHPLAGKYRKKRDDTTVDLKTVGGGVEWIGPLIVGGQKFLVQFDTGSPDLIVNSKAYDPSKSKSAKDTHKKFESSYGDGTHGEGEVYSDTLKLGDAAADSVSIGRSNQPITHANEEDGNQGIAGLSFMSISGFKRNDKKSKSIHEALGSSKAITHNVYQFTLSKNSSSQLHIGGVDKSKISSDVKYVNVDPKYGFWVTSVEVSGVKIKGVIDSGTTIIIGPKKEVVEVFNKIDGIEVVSRHGRIFGAYDCDRDLGITFNIGGKHMRIPKELQSFGSTGDGRCVVSIASSPSAPPLNAWVIGDTLFQGNSIIFDVEKSRIGFATAK